MSATSSKLVPNKKKVAVRICGRHYCIDRIHSYQKECAVSSLCRLSEVPSHVRR